jgi:hypothetical protein
MVEEVVDLRRLKLDGRDRRIDLQSLVGEGFVERHRRFLQIGDACVTDAVFSGDVIDVPGEGHLLIRKSLLHLSPQLHQLIEHELDVRIHGSEL